jgi:hypothetical protein
MQREGAHPCICIIGLIAYQQCYEATARSCSWELLTRTTSRFHNNYDARSQIRQLPIYDVQRHLRHSDSWVTASAFINSRNNVFAWDFYCLSKQFWKYAYCFYAPLTVHPQDSRTCSAPPQRRFSEYSDTPWTCGPVRLHGMVVSHLRPAP